MLVLTRKTNEVIVINGNIRIRVLSSDGGRIRLGIEAPRSIPIERSELHAANHGESWAGTAAAPALAEVA